MSTPIRLYLAGPMENMRTPNVSLIHATVARLQSETARLRALGYLVTSPAEIVAGPNWGDRMRANIKQLVDCHALATLPGWEISKGAGLEVYIARELRMPVWNAEDLIVPLQVPA